MNVFSFFLSRSPRSLSHALLLKIEILILIRVCRAQQLVLSFETSGSRHLSKALTSPPSERGNEREREGEKRKSDCSMNFSFSSHADNRNWYGTIVKELHEYRYTLFPDTLLYKSIKLKQPSVWHLQVVNLLYKL